MCVTNSPEGRASQARSSIAEILAWPNEDSNLMGNAWPSEWLPCEALAFSLTSRVRATDEWWNIFETLQVLPNRVSSDALESRAIVLEDLKVLRDPVVIGKHLLANCVFLDLDVPLIENIPPTRTNIQEIHCTLLNFNVAVRKPITGDVHKRSIALG